MTLATRLRALEADVPAAHPIPPGDGWARAYVAFLALVPADLRGAVAARLGGPYGPDTEPLADWVAAPFARWAPPPPPGYQLPRALVGWALAPPRPFWFGHHCGTCGLAVPLFLSPSALPDLPADLRVFPICPGCGGATSHAAVYRPDPAPMAREELR
jgi:hypothetical protein